MIRRLFSCALILLLSAGCASAEGIQTRGQTGGALRTATVALSAADGAAQGNARESRGTAASAPIYSLIRLQVVAADDGAAAQALKLELRDCCLEAARICLDGAADADAAYMRLEDCRQTFEAACRARARALGSDAEISAEVGRFDFPDRLYGDVLVPAGSYRALRVTIGAGTGHNWWCVLYPGLCLLDEADYAGAEPRLDSAVLKWLKKILNGEEAEAA